MNFFQVITAEEAWPPLSDASLTVGFQRPLVFQNVPLSFSSFLQCLRLQVTHQRQPQSKAQTSTSIQTLPVKSASTVFPTGRQF